MRPEVRSAHFEEIGVVARAMRAGGMGAHVDSLLRHSITSPTSDVFVAVHGGEVIGAVAVVIERGGRVVGSAVHSPWGPGPSVVASDHEAGLTLLSTLRHAPGAPLTLGMPDANTDAVSALRNGRFQVVNEATRMRWGVPPTFEPQRIFGMFNLFWG